MTDFDDILDQEPAEHIEADLVEYEIYANMRKVEGNF